MEPGSNETGSTAGKGPSRTVRACIPMALAMTVKIDVAARVFERFGEVVELDMQRLRSGGEVYVTFAEAAAAEELLRHAAEIVKELASSQQSASSDTADWLRSELLEGPGDVDYVSLLAPTPDEVPSPFGAGQEVPQTMQFIPERVAAGMDLRTSVVVSGVPAKCTSERFLHAMKLCQLNTKLRFFYLPVDDLANALGYAFLDFEQPVYILQLQRQLPELAHGLGMVFQNAYISYSRIQGRSRLLEHFRGSDIMFCPDANKRPQFFFPDCG